MSFIYRRLQNEYLCHSFFSLSGEKKEFLNSIKKRHPKFLLQWDLYRRYLNARKNRRWPLLDSGGDHNGNNILVRNQIRRE